MKLAIKSTIAAAVLSLAAATALAAPPTVPTQPVAGPIPTVGTGNGGLVFYGYDTVAQTSLTLWLGLNLDDVLTPDMTADLNFGVLSGWSTAFGSSTASNVNWFIAAGDFTPSSGTVYSGNRLAVTAAGDMTGNIRNSALRGALGEMQSFIQTRVNVGTNDNPSLADAITDTNWMYHGSQINDFAGGARVNFVTTTAHSNTGSELPFWFIQGNGTLGTQQSSVTGYIGKWILAANGALTYDVPGGGGAPVPLPAAAWLLLSGLAGLGAVARRRGQEAA